MLIRTMHSFRPGHIFVAASAFCLASLTTGCGMNSGTSTAAHTTSGSSAPSPKAWGQVHGGNLPVTGATVSLYVAGVNTPSTGVTGYGSGATLLAYTTTDATGSFSFLVDANSTYVCPTPTALTSPAVALPLQAYLVVSGGNPGLATGSSNPGLGMMAALGNCPAGGTLASSIPFVDIDEVTTVAAVWALQQFMGAPAAGNAITSGNFPQIGAPNTLYSNGLTGTYSYTNSGGTTSTTNNAVSVQSAVQGMSNAFVTARILADIGTGKSPNTNYNSYATPETAKINTLADIIAYCINSDPISGDAAYSNHCSSFYTAATPSGYTATDTIQAAWYMAQNPIHNISTLYGYVAGAGAPFTPTLGAPGTGASTTNTTALFNDTTVAINYAPYGPSLPRNLTPTNNAGNTGQTYALYDAGNIAFDAYGNSWYYGKGNVAAATVGPGGCTANCATSSITLLGPDGNVAQNQLDYYNSLPTSGGVSASLTTKPGVVQGRYIALGGGMAVDLANRIWMTDYQAFYTAKATVGGVPNTNVLVGNVVVTPGATQASYNQLNGGGGTYTNGTGYLVGTGTWDVAVDGNNNLIMSDIIPATGVVAQNSYTYANYNYLNVNKMSATDASGYTSTANGTLPTALGTSYIDIDGNSNVGSAKGGVVWVSNYTGCTVTGNLHTNNQAGATGASSATTANNLTSYGSFSLFNDSTLASLTATNVVTSVSGAVTGAATTVPVATAPYGNTGNCGGTGYSIGQVITAATANPFGIAVDRNNGAWVSDQFFPAIGSNVAPKTGFDGLTYLSAAPSATGNLPSAYTLVNGVLPTSSVAGTQGTTLQEPAKLAVDGNNNVWVPNGFTAGTTGSVAEASFNSTSGTISLLTPGQGSAYGNSPYGIGFQHTLAGPEGIAIDPSGNVWITNASPYSGSQLVSYTTSAGTTGMPIYCSVTVIVGAAGPVITPKALALKYGMVGQKP